jgi:hypothetical protein
MNFAGNAIILFEKEINAGGIQYVPPACCLRAAYVSAHAAAHVERTGRARTKVLKGSWTVRPLVGKSPIWRLESAA